MRGGGGRRRQLEVQTVSRPGPSKTNYDPQPHGPLRKEQGDPCVIAVAHRLPRPQPVGGCDEQDRRQLPWLTSGVHSSPDTAVWPWDCAVQHGSQKKKKKEKKKQPSSSVVLATRHMLNSHRTFSHHKARLWKTRFDLPRILFSVRRAGF